LVVVTDSGAGISEENQKRLFREIVQFNHEKLHAGGSSGLGLWISRGIMVVVTDSGAGIRLFKEIVQFNPEKLQAGGGS
jgi:signal transduction histidine kinase